MSAVIEKIQLPDRHTFLGEKCRQCEKDGVFDYEGCVDAIDDTNFLHEEEFYRTSDDKTCWSKDTYEKWLKPNKTNPNTRAELRDNTDSSNESNDVFNNVRVDDDPSEAENEDLSLLRRNRTWNGTDGLDQATDLEIGRLYGQIFGERDEEQKEIKREELRQYLLTNVTKFLPERLYLWGHEYDRDSRKNAKLLFDATWIPDDKDKGPYDENVLEVLIQDMYWEEGATKYYIYYSPSLSEDKKNAALEALNFFNE